MGKNIIQAIRNSISGSGKSVVIMLSCLMASLQLSAQTRNVKGTVLDPAGDPVIGATVRVEGTQRATVTDADGVFQIQATTKDKIRVSYVGMNDAVVTANKATIAINLTDDTNLIDELVVVGYGAQKKATLTGAVSAITNKEIVTTKSESVVNMLSGKIPGVRITQMSSQPGAYDNKIDIRGMGDPLIVVDGISRDKAYFGRMDANEIESISVLKDASASIYGVRAANGVILVTTKHGTNNGKEKFNVTLSTNWGWQSFLYIPETASATTHMLLMNEKYKYGINDNYPSVHNDARYSWEKMMEYSAAKNPGTNWTKELFDTNVPQQQHNISIDGSSKKIDYFVNLGYLEQMGAYSSKSMNYDRWNFRSNVDARITDRIKLGVQLSGYMDERNEPFTDIWAVYKKAWTYRPTSEAYLNGDRSMPAYDTEMLESENPVAAINSDYTGYRKYKNVNFNGAVTLQYDFKYVKGLNAKAFYSYDYSTTNNTELKKSYYLYRDMGDGEIAKLERNSPGTLRRQTNPYYGNVMQLSLNYNRKFGDHNVAGLLLFEEQYSNGDNFYAQRSMMLASEYLIAGETEEQIGAADKGGIWDQTRRALVGRVNYDYKGRYMVEAAFREDGSSKWAKGHRWGFFPSVSVGWRASEEPWLKKAVPYLTNLKLRASYGEMGDDAVAGNYPPTSVGYNLEQHMSWFYGNTFMQGVSPTSIPNPNLTWYTAKTYNAGLDWDLWNGMFSGTVELFKRHRDGLLASSSVILPGTVGADMPQENMNSDETFGWEISLGHRNRVADVNYWVNAQISATKNRFDRNVQANGQNSYENWRNLNLSGRNKDIWMSIAEAGRFDNIEQIQHHSVTGGGYGQGTLPGDYYYEDWNNDGIIDGNDEHPVATFNMPVFNYGISLGADWRGIDLSMNWQGAAGVYNSYGEVFTEVGPFNGGAALSIYTDRWHTANIDDDPWNPATQWVEGLYPVTGHSFSSYATGIKNTSYLRLKSLEVGYSLPRTWMKYAGIQSVRVYVNAYNLLTFTGIDNIDPERPGSRGINGGGENASLFYRYPVNRTFNIGATVKF
ncbi:MAG: TonB-dependent receptor [Prevotellaceae bacterium]|nr:TonB-dependent receptor [Prevotellaceae bacterium]